MTTFSENNKNFINIYFGYNQKKLPINDRIFQYKNIKVSNLTIQEETRSRILDYYIKEGFVKPAFFYKELLDLLGDLELTFLFSNLIFEEKAIDILNYLNQSNFLQTLKFDSNDIDLGFEICHLVTENRSVSTVAFEAIISLLYIRRFEALTNIRFNIDTSDQSAALKSYAIWLYRNISISRESIESYILFSLIWKTLHSNENEKKLAYNSIIFVHYLIEEFNLNPGPKLAVFINELEIYFNDMFVTPVYVPLMVRETPSIYPTGYRKNKEKLQEIIKISKHYKDVSLSNTYLELFKKLIICSDYKLFNYIESVLRTKTFKGTQFCIDEAEAISRLKMNERVLNLKRFVFGRFYLYEYV
jgi:hypothetical protein